MPVPRQITQGPTDRDADVQEVFAVMIYVGTSGFSYPEWKGIVYPEDLPDRQYLSFYGQHFSSAEINNTFYRFPSAKTTQTWSEQVPDDFRFTLKMNRKVTHRKRLTDVEEEMDWFFNGASSLGGKLGTVLVQLPPYFRCNLEALDGFLARHAQRARLALEFRHDSWFEDETLRLLESYGAALVVMEADERAAMRAVTAPFLYARLRKTAYSNGELQEWADWISGQPGGRFVYLKHGQKGPLLARQLEKYLQRCLP